MSVMVAFSNTNQNFDEDLLVTNLQVYRVQIDYIWIQSLNFQTRAIS